MYNKEVDVNGRADHCLDSKPTKLTPFSLFCVASRILLVAASDSLAVEVLRLHHIVVQGRRPPIKLGDHLVSCQPTVAFPEPGDADVDDLSEHVVVLNQGLLHELVQRHPLQA